MPTNRPELSDSDIFSDESESIEETQLQLSVADEAPTLKLPALQSPQVELPRLNTALQFKVLLIKGYFIEEISAVKQTEICEDQSVLDVVELKGIQDKNQIYYSLLFTVLVYSVLHPNFKRETFDKFAKKINSTKYLDIKIPNSHVVELSSKKSDKLKQYAFEAMKRFISKSEPSLNL